MDNTDPVPLGIYRSFMDNTISVQYNFTAVLLQCSTNNLNQSALPRSIFSYESVHLPLSEIHRNIKKNSYTKKTF